MKRLVVVLFLMLAAAGVAGIWALVATQRHEAFCDRLRAREEAEVQRVFDREGPLKDLALGSIDRVLAKEGC